MITVHTVPALLAALPSYAATLLAASICWSAVEVNWKKAHSNWLYVFFYIGNICSAIEHYISSILFLSNLTYDFLYPQWSLCTLFQLFLLLFQAMLPLYWQHQSVEAWARFHLTDDHALTLWPAYQTHYSLWSLGGPQKQPQYSIVNWPFLIVSSNLIIINGTF